MTFLWFMDGVTPQDRKRVRLGPSTGLASGTVRSQRRIRESHGCLAVLLPVAATTTGANWVLNRENLQSFATRANVDALQTFWTTRDAGEHARQPRSSLDRGSFARSI